MPTSKASLSLAVRKQAITSGLSIFLNGDDLKSAVDHWVQNYRDKPTFAIQRFVQDVVQTYQLENQRREITQNLITKLNKTVLTEKIIATEVDESHSATFTDTHNGALLPTKPSEAITDNNRRKEVLEEMVPKFHYLEAFISIYTQFLGHLPKAEKSIFLKKALPSIKKNKILKNHKEVITDLYLNEVLPEVYEEAPEVLTEIINHLSFEMTKKYGAKLADDWLLQSVRSARMQHSDEIIDSLI